jgi:hypothetical protein
MQYNPANLIYSDAAVFSFFRYPGNIYGFISAPFISLNATAGIGSGQAIGIEYTYLNFGNWEVISEQGPPATEKVHFYERSFSAGYALELNDQAAIGAQVRYTVMPIPHLKNITHLSFSGGVTYRPEFLSDRLTLGLSFINFGVRVDEFSYIDSSRGYPRKVDVADPPPSQINIGAEGSPVKNKFFEVTAALSAMKPIAKMDTTPYFTGQSSFESLFNDWDDFPNDMTARFGIGYLWKPIALGGGLHFLHEMYVGYFTVGPKEYPNAVFTHGIMMGLEYACITATAGYAGRWYKSNGSSYLDVVFPWETFQFSLSTNGKIFEGEKEEAGGENILESVILSGGYSGVEQIGRMKKENLYRGYFSYRQTPVYSLETDFYFEKEAALLLSLNYTRMTLSRTDVYPPSWSWTTEKEMETFSLESGFRYHPLEIFRPFFLQAALGIIRMNPIDRSVRPKYFYKSYDVVSAGIVIPVMNLGIVVIPQAGLRTYFMEGYYWNSQLVGYNQLEYGVNIGYQL